MILAIFILMAMGGFIAYGGDYLGLKLGKKRLSLFGLRPRSTASLVGIALGALTALLTFAVLLALDRSFRIAVQRGAELVDSNYHLSLDNRKLKKQSAQEQAAAGQAQDAAVKAQVATTQALTAAIQAQQDAKQAHLGVARAESQLKASRAELVREQAAVASAKSQLNGVQGQLASTRSELGSAQHQVALAQTRSAALETNIAQERKIEGSLHQFSLTERLNTLLYRKGQEVGRTTVAVRQPVSAIQGEISLFLSQLSAQALTRGASRGANGHAVQLLKIAFARNPVNPGSDQGDAPAPLFMVGEQDNINALADNIHNYSGGAATVALIAYASGNSFAGQTVTVTLSPFSNQRVLAAGQTIAQVTLPSSKRSYDQITEGIMRLLQSARQNAVRQGVIPVEINPATNETQLGDVPFSTLYDIVDQVRRQPASEPVVMTARAGQDTSSIDQLHLSFTVGGTPVEAIERENPACAVAFAMPDSPAIYINRSRH